MNAVEKAHELGATVEGGINWTWAKGFPSKDIAMEFLAWLDGNGYEHRGYYPADDKQVDGIRFR